MVDLFYMFDDFKNSTSENFGKKVFVGMSGGVDSSVSALILKEQGYDVTGVFIKVWQPDFVECTWKEDRLDAMRICAQINIPFITLDLEKEYKEGVIDYMFDEYRKGRTPNPDVMCNREVKFGAFLKWALVQGADFVATGHYAQVSGVIPAKAGTQCLSLVKGLDKNKDQSYFLWTLTEEQLKHIIFPIGGMEKKDVRKKADEAKLFTSDKKDSQGLCFIGTIDVKEFLKSQIEEKKGDVINESGEVIGNHDGITFYTIGERHGFEITKKTDNDTPYYVIKKDIEKNILIVSQTPPVQPLSKEISLEKINWIENPDESKIYEARARYRAPLAKVKIKNYPASLENSDGTSKVFVVEGELVATEGQSLVIYEDEVCIGGGIIG